MTLISHFLNVNGPVSETLTLSKVLFYVIFRSYRCLTLEDCNNLQEKAITFFERTKFITQSACTLRQTIFNKEHLVVVP